jgi:energy-coupling factor transport system substrate-specific component
MAANTQTGIDPHGVTRHWLGSATLIVISLIGVLAFAAPFFAPNVQQTGETTARLSDSPLITSVLVVACLVVVFANLGSSLSSKSVALLGVLVGVNVVLRIVDLSFLPPGEFSPLFVLMILVGYVFGAQMGFLMGTLTMIASALFTGGVGPWLPFQMITCGWIGLTASWLRFGEVGANPHREVIRLAAFGAVWGFLYGVILNLYFYPFVVGGWIPGSSPSEAITRYMTFYAVQSVAQDALRAGGNVILLLVLGVPLLRAFVRFRRRFEVNLIR